MSTFIDYTNDRDGILTQLLAVAAVTTAFPVTTLSGGASKRFTTALQVLSTTPANAQVKDENGDVLCVSFVSANPYAIMLTQRGKQRREMEIAASPGL